MPDTPMTTAAWITMIVILTFVWGGFAALLIKSFRSEARRPRD